MESRQQGVDELKKACVSCGQEYPGNLELCPDDGTLLTPIGKEPKVGEIFADRYEILGIIGDGGMGKVYKARHNLMKRLVAIKMLLPHLVQSAAALKRFQQEAQAASALNHPNILTVYDFGISDKGMPFLVMDYLEGTSLAALLQEQGSLGPERCIHIFSQACLALAHAHQKGVIHRDLKPANIMLIDYDGQPDFLKIVDFGIAKLLQPDGAEQLTHTGEVFGSPLYMSPEQCRGRELDARSDIYSLGCVMYRCLTGKPVFAGRDPMECMYKQVNDSPMSFNDIVPELGLADKLESAVFRAISKEPDERYTSMLEFRDALEECREHRVPPTNKVFAVPVDSPMNVPEDFRTDKMRRPAELISTQFAGGAAHHAHTEPSSQAVASTSSPNPAVAGVPVAPGTTASPEAPAASSDTPSVGSSAAVQAVSGTMPPYAVPTGDETQTAAWAHLNSDSATMSGLQTGNENAANAQTGSLPPAPAEPSGAQPPVSGASGANAISSSLPVSSADAESSLASKSPGDHHQPPPLGLLLGGAGALILIGALAMFSMKGDEKKPVELPVTHDLTPAQEQKANVSLLIDKAKVQISQDDFLSGEKTLQDALEAASTQNKSDEKQEAVLPVLGDVYSASDKFGQAQASFQKLLDLQNKHNAPPTVIAHTKTLIALAMLEQGDYDDAEPLLQDAQKSLEAAPPDQQTGLSDVLYGLSKIAVGRGDYDQAISYLQTAIGRKTKLGSAGSGDLAQYLQDLSEIYLLQNRLPLAEQTLGKVLKVANDRYGEDSPQAADAFKDLATLYFQKGQLSKAETYFNKSLSIKSKSFGEMSVSAAEVMTALAMLYTREKKYVQADGLFRKALEIRTKELGADSPQAKRTRELYAVLQKRMKGR